MKKITTLLVTLLISASGFSQNGFSKITCNLSPVSTATFANRSCLFIDNAGNKWVGFSNTAGTSKKLVKYSGNTWTDYSSTISATTLKVRDINQDNANNIWIATDQGLYKYDGVSFTNFNTSNSTIVSNNLYAVATNGSTIIAGSAAGLSVYNGATFSNFSKANSGMSSDTVYCIKVENSSSIWLGTNYGVNKYDGVNTITQTGLFAKINCMTLDAVNDKWFGTATKGIYKYNGSGFTNINTIYTNLVSAAIPLNCFSLSMGPNNTVYTPTYWDFSSISPKGLISFSLSGSSTFYKFPTVPTFFANTANSNCYLAYSSLTPDTLFFVGQTNTFNSTKPFLNKFAPQQYTPDLSDITPQNLVYLDINQVKAGFSPNADMHWDGANPKYEVPKGSGKFPLQNSSFWIGGYNGGTSLKMGAMTYRQHGVDFWPGIIGNASGIDTTIAHYFNKVWKINKADVDSFKANYLNGNVQSGAYTVPNDILSWPWVDFDGEPLGYFVDVNADGSYDPTTHGDYPKIKGDQMVLWIFNDSLASHGETTGGRMGIQVVASAYAYSCPNLPDSEQVLNYTTFYNFRVTNKSNNQYDSVYFAYLANTSLGNYADDYIGCDVNGNFGFTYNGDNFDEDMPGTSNGYGTNVPYFSCNVLQGAAADEGDGIDNDHDGCIDCTNYLDSLGNPTGFTDPDYMVTEYNMMSGFNYYNETADPKNGDPTITGNGIQYYNLMSSRWKDNTPITFGKNGINSGSIPPCKYLYPGVSDPGNIGTSLVIPPFTNWTERNTDGANMPNVDGDRRFLISSGKFTLTPWAPLYFGIRPTWVNEFDFALVFTQDSAAQSNGTLYNKVVQDNQKVKSWFKNNNAPSCASPTGIKNYASAMQAKIYPNPAKDIVTIEFEQSESDKVSMKVYDVIGNIVKTLALNTAASNRSTISIADLTPGVYFIELSNSRGQVTKKLVKQ